jgi:hypothetical protein
MKASNILLGAGVVATSWALGLYSKKYAEMRPGETWQLSLRSSAAKFSPQVVSSLTSALAARGITVTGSSTSDDGSVLILVAKYDSADKIALGSPIPLGSDRSAAVVTDASRLSP